MRGKGRRQSQRVEDRRGTRVRGGAGGAKWFNHGLRSGKLRDGDTFSIPYNQL